MFSLNLFIWCSLLYHYFLEAISRSLSHANIYRVRKTIDFACVTHSLFVWLKPTHTSHLIWDAHLPAADYFELGVHKTPYLTGIYWITSLHLEQVCIIGYYPCEEWFFLRAEMSWKWQYWICVKQLCSFVSDGCRVWSFQWSFMKSTEINWRSCCFESLNFDLTDFRSVLQCAVILEPTHYKLCNVVIATSFSAIDTYKQRPLIFDSSVHRFVHNTKFEAFSIAVRLQVMQSGNTKLFEDLGFISFEQKQSTWNPFWKKIR